MMICFSETEVSQILALPEHTIRSWLISGRLFGYSADSGTSWVIPRRSVTKVAKDFGIALQPLATSPPLVDLGDYYEINMSNYDDCCVSEVSAWAGLARDEIDYWRCLLGELSEVL